MTTGRSRPRPPGPLTQRAELESALEDEDPEQATLLLSEVQLLLAEKRTSLATVRTGIAVCALPLSIVGLLIATSKMYELPDVWHMLLPLLVVCAVILGLGIYLAVRAMLGLRRIEAAVDALKSGHPRLGDLMP